MIQSFKDEGTEAVFYGRGSQKARKTCPTQSDGGPCDVEIVDYH